MITFEKSSRADYAVRAQFVKSGRRITVLVNKAERLSASVRSGSYEQGWEAKFGQTVVFEKTRQEAFRALQIRMAADNTPIVEA
jgi:hypothetical protein